MDNNKKKDKLYVFGGSFDPFHIGHEAIVKAIVKEFGSIFLIPTQNPWKPHGLLPLNHRVEVLKEFYKDNQRVTVSDLCIQDPEYNYMYKLVEHFPDKKIIFVMGEDSFMSYPQWKNYADFNEKVETLVFKRNTGSTLPDAPRIRLLPLELYQFEISSSVCRQNLKKNRALLPPKVYELTLKKISDENP